MADLNGTIAVGLVVVSNDDQYALTADDQAELIERATGGLLLLDSLEQRADINFVVQSELVVLDDAFVWTNEIADTWPGWPAGWNQVDAVVQRPDGKIYFFSGAEYLRYTPGSGVDSGYPRQIAPNWSGWPATWYATGIDAAVRHPNGNYYFFKGDEYVKHVPSEGVGDSYPRRIADNWTNWPADWTHVDGAMLRTDSDGRIQFFRDDELLRYVTGGGDDGGVADGSRLPIGVTDPEDGSPGTLLFLPSEFHSNIDAAHQDPDGRVYLFKGSRYCRYPGFGYETMERSWRDSVNEQLGFPGGVDEFAQHLMNQTGASAAIVAYITSCPVAWVGYAGGRRHVVHESVRNWGNDVFARVFAHETAHLFGAQDEYGDSSCSKRSGSLQVPNRNARKCSGTQHPCLMDGPGEELCAWSRFQVGWNYGLAHIGAAVEFDPDRAYVFSGTTYSKYLLERTGQTATGYPRNTPSNWNGWPSHWNRVDAALKHPNGKVYMFSGNEYARYTIGEGFDDGYPKPIAQAWDGWPALWYATGIDAAVEHPHGNVYFFKGGQYLRHVPGEGVDSSYPRPIADNWANWPTTAQWSHVDGALYRSNNDKIYFFSGDEYVRFTPGSGVDDGYPQDTRDWWGGLLRY